MIRDFIRYLFRRTSTNASVVCIIVSESMTNKDLRDIAEYFRSLIENRDCIDRLHAEQPKE